MSTTACLCLMFVAGQPIAFASNYPAPKAPKKTRYVYSDAAEIRRMPYSVLQLHPEVRVQGTVTHANTLRRDFFIQDDYNGLYIEPFEGNLDIKPGDRVEVEGHADPGLFAPCVVARRVTKLGPTKLPEPIPFDLNESESRWLDAQYVTVFTEIMEIRAEQEHLVLSIGTTRIHGTVYLPGLKDKQAIEKMMGHPVCIRGVCVPKFNARRTVVGPPRIHISSLAQIQQLQTRSTIAPPIELTASELKSFIPLPFQGSRRVRLDGIIVAKEGGRLYLQDGDQGVTISTKTPEPMIQTGHLVKVNGMLNVTKDVYHLTHATVLDMGPGVMPTPITPDPLDLVNGVKNGTRVRIRGTVLPSSGKDKPQSHAVIDLGSCRVVVVSEGPAFENVEWPDGATVEIVGTAVKIGLWAKSDSGLLIETPSDITILKYQDPPPFWNLARLIFVSLALTGLVLVGAAWVFVLRRALSRQRKLLRVKADREAELADKLRQSQKMEAIGRLAGGIAHDFNNMLTVINGASEILPAVMTEEPHLARTLANDIRHAGTKAAGLVAQLLTFSRQRPTQLAPINLNDVVLDCEKMLKRVIGEDVKVFTIRDEELPSILGEPILLHQVIVNLAVNARDAMPKGGTVTIATRRYQSANNTPMVRLSVADSGCGMTPEVREKLFEPFFTTKPIGQGTGLGLATVYGIVQTLKGMIHVESELNVGTTFDIDFPLAPIHAESSTELPTISRILKMNSKRTILLVEDDDAVRSLTTRILEMQGYIVNTADAPDVALEILATQTFDLLITDVVMPGMGGRELADKARIRYPDIRILFISGYTADEVLRRGVQEDDVDFLNKPFTTTQMSEKVQHILLRKAKPGGKSSLQLRPTPPT